MALRVTAEKRLVCKTTTLLILDHLLDAAIGNQFILRRQRIQFPIHKTLRYLYLVCHRSAHMDSFNSDWFSLCDVIIPKTKTSCHAVMGRDT